MQHLYGWNVSFVLSFIINTWGFIEVRKVYDFSLLKEVTIIKRPVKYVVNILFLYLFFVYIYSLFFYNNID